MRPRRTLTHGKSTSQQCVGVGNLRACEAREGPQALPSLSSALNLGCKGWRDCSEVGQEVSITKSEQVHLLIISWFLALGQHSLPAPHWDSREQVGGTV